MTSRADRLTERLAGAGVDAVLITELVNVRYLTGFTGSSGLALIGPSTRAFVTDFRYVEQAAEEVNASFDRRRAPTDLLEAIQDVLPGAELRLGFEEPHLSVREHRRLRELLPDRIELVGGGRTGRGPARGEGSRRGGGHAGPLPGWPTPHSRR